MTLRMPIIDLGPNIYFFGGGGTIWVQSEDGTITCLSDGPTTIQGQGEQT
jgi:hypothetical protein